MNSRNREFLSLFLKKQKFSKKIVEAFKKVSREKFVSRDFRTHAYDNTTLPIGGGQTISQPHVIATMLSLLEIRKNQKILEIGSGSGYVLALISELVGKKGKIFGVERIKKLALNSEKKLSNYKNIKIYNQNGFSGLKEKAPFDRILISAACREIPEKILAQLKNNGILVAPKGSRFQQSLLTIQKKDDKFITKNKIPGFIFVPFVEEG